VSRTYDVVHSTRYTYEGLVTGSYGRAVLLPRELPWQTRHEARVEVSPEPADTAEHTDWFGNTSTYFSLTRPHDELVVTATSRVSVHRDPVTAAELPAVTWEDVARAVRHGGTTSDVGAAPGAEGEQAVALREALLTSRHVAADPAVRAWAAPSFAPGRRLTDVLVDLVHRVATEMAYRPGSTTLTTTQAQLLDQRAGVCQDFAHLVIAALRLHGVPARYVSGYLETQPPPGRAKLRGADAAHAWVAAWVPGAGWVEIDPTNDTFVDDRYVVLGWGRDYADVPPLRGVIFTEGGASRPQVAVDLTPVDGPTPADPTRRGKIEP
jgi:transglutaminase-like putative cysteine protease